MTPTSKLANPRAAFLCALVLILSAFLTVSSAHAQLSVSSVGTETGAAVTNWSSAATSKTYNLGTNEVYGTAGYYQIRPGSSQFSEAVGGGNNLGTTSLTNPTLFSAPSFLSTTGSAGTFVNFSPYPTFLAPDGSTSVRQGSLSVSVNGGPFAIAVAPGVSSYYGIAASFTLNSAVDFRLGLVVDTVADGAYAPNFVGIYNNVSGTVTSGLLTRNGQPDMVFFDITGGTNGQSFDIALWQTNGSQSVAALGMITYDASRYNFAVASGSQTNSSVLSGAPAALLKTGAGTTVLTGVSTYQGTTTISNGAVELGASGQLASGSYSGAVSLATNSSSLQVNTSANQTLSGAISGSGSLVKSANGTLTLSGSNSYSGGTTISGGRVIASSTEALGDAGAAVTVSGGAFLQLATNITRTGAVTFDGGKLQASSGSSLTKNGGSYALSNAAEIDAGLGGTAGLTRGGAGVSILWKSNSYTGTTVVTGGSLRLDGSGNLSSSTTLQVDSGATFSMTGLFLTSNNVTVAGLTNAGTVFGGSGTLTVNAATNTLQTSTGKIEGGIGLTLAGATQLSLSGSNNYTGSTLVGADNVLFVADANGLGSTAAGTTVVTGGVLRLAGTNAGGSGITVGAEALTISGAGRAGSGGALRSASGTNTWQGAITLAADARIGAAANNMLTLDVASGNAITAANFNLSTEGAGHIRVNDAISLGTGGLTKTGTGSLILAASNSYSGATTLLQGILAAGAAGGGQAFGNLSALTISVSNNTTLDLNNFNQTIGSLAGGTNIASNGVSLGSGTLTTGGDNTSTTFAGRISGTGGLVKTGAGTQTLTGANTYSGGTLVSAGALSGNTTSLQGNITNNASVILDQSGSGTFANVLSGSGILTKIGSGTLTLSALNTYSGGTLLNGGWLTAGHTNAFGTGSITVGSGTTLNLSNFAVANQVVNSGGTILSTGQVSDVVATNGTTDIGGNSSTITEVGGSATVNVSGTSVTVNQATGGTLNISGSDARVATLSGGTVNANAAGLVVTNFNGGSIAVSNGLTVGLRSGSSSGLITGAGGVVKQSSDTLTLTANNTYTGATTVEAGKLVVNGSISSAATVQNGATLGGSGTLASATIESGGTIGPGNSPGTLTLTNGLTWAGGGNYNWQIYDANISGTPGQTNTWDLITVAGGSWDITGLSSTNKFNINLWSLSGLPDTTGTPLNFNPSGNYSWKILDLAGATAGFNTNLFNINTTAVNGTGGFVGATGLFALELNNNDLFLTYQGASAAVPEPGTWAAGGMLLILAAGAAWRKKARAKSVLPCG